MTKTFGIIGWPAKHSLSPRIHACWYHEHGIDARYEILETPPEAFGQTVAALAERGFSGANVTIPFKERALALVETADATAKAIGAVNTFILKDGRVAGANTDAYGFLQSLKHAASDLSSHLEKAVVLGAGGAARAVVYALADAGAKEIVIVARAPAKAEGIPRARSVAWESLPYALEGATLLVNTTPLGMKGHAPLELSLEALPMSALVADIVYAPLETELLKAARARGNPAVDGLGMLLYQAQESFRLWHGVTPQVTEALRRQMSNQVTNATDF